MKVSLLDLQAQYASIKTDVLAAVEEVLDSQVCIGGPKVSDLERAVAKVSDCEHAVGVSSGTDALLASLMALNIGPGDEVITTPFTFFATAGSIVRVGATPVFVDIDPCTYNLDPALIRQAVTPHTKAIMPVHLFGQMAEMDRIMAVAREHGLAVIEDAAQSITSTYRGKKAGSVGTTGCFSFFPSKNLGGAGDGGMVVTNDSALHERLMLMRNHGAKPKYFHKMIGGNFRLDPIQAAILLVKLRHLDAWSEARRQNALWYDRAFRGTSVQTPSIRPYCVSIFNQYVIRVQRRAELMDHLKERGVGCEIYYPMPMHLQQCFENLGYREGDCPEAERAAGEVLAIPVYPELPPEQRQYVVESVLEATEPRASEAGF
jgi:dTDP-4-amino-4,6-dideoxygalactose transaminase